MRAFFQVIMASPTPGSLSNDSEKLPLGNFLLWKSPAVLFAVPSTNHLLCVLSAVILALSDCHSLFPSELG